VLFFKEVHGDFFKIAAAAAAEAPPIASALVFRSSSFPLPLALSLSLSLSLSFFPSCAYRPVSRRSSHSESAAPKEHPEG